MHRPSSPAPVAAFLATTALLSACAPTAPTAAVPRFSACDDPVYVDLIASDPDTLTEREWTRLQQLEELCLLERRAADARHPTVDGSAHRGLHGTMWLWMPAMMAFGGLMWLMMGT